MYVLENIKNCKVGDIFLYIADKHRPIICRFVYINNKEFVKPHGLFNVSTYNVGTGLYYKRHGIWETSEIDKRMIKMNINKEKMLLYGKLFFDDI